MSDAVLAAIIGAPCGVVGALLGLWLQGLASRPRSPRPRTVLTEETT